MRGASAGVALAAAMLAGCNLLSGVGDLPEERDGDATSQTSTQGASDAVGTTSGAGGAGANAGTGGTAGTVLIHPTDDAFVNLSQPDTNKGAEPQLRVNDMTAGDPKHTYIRFDLTGLPAVAKEAVLSVTVFDLSCSASVWLVTDDAWSELTLVPNNAPRLDAAIAKADLGPGVVAVDLTDEVNTELAGDRVITVAIQSEGPSGDVSMHSKEAADQTSWPGMKLAF